MGQQLPRSITYVTVSTFLPFLMDVEVLMDLAPRPLEPRTVELLHREGVREGCSRGRG